MAGTTMLLDEGSPAVDVTGLRDWRGGMSRCSDKNVQ
jgi:hypothetical protein